MFWCKIWVAVKRVAPSELVKKFTGIVRKTIKELKTGWYRRKTPDLS